MYKHAYRHMHRHEYARVQQAAAVAAEEAELRQALERSKITAAAEVPYKTLYTPQK